MARRWFDIGVYKERSGPVQFCLLHISPAIAANFPGNPSPPA
jgi:hypothetical protein